MYCLQVDGSVEWVAAEDECAAAIERERLFQYVLYGDAIGAVVNGIGAEHVECSLVVVCGLDHSVAVERDIVAGVLVHEQTYGGVGRAVDVEVDVHV